MSTKNRNKHRKQIKNAIRNITRFGVASADDDIAIQARERERVQQENTEHNAAKGRKFGLKGAWRQASNKAILVSCRADVKAFGAEKMKIATLMNMEKQNAKFITKRRKNGGTVPTPQDIVNEYTKEPEFIEFYKSIGITMSMINALAREAVKNYR